MRHGAKLPTRVSSEHQKPQSRVTDDSKVGDQMITADQLNKIDMPDTMLKVKHPKTGIEGYRVGLEVFHQLHCIDLLRQVTYHEWYEDISGEFLEGREHLQMHTGKHCDHRENTQRL